MPQSALELRNRMPGAAPPRPEALLGLPGVIVSDNETVAPDAAEIAAASTALEAALDALLADRAAEGARLGAQLSGQLAAIARLTAAARTEASDQPRSQQLRLQESLARLLASETSLDPARLAQEVALLATRADVTEELDRLESHLAAAGALLGGGGAVGRKLDFLAQEFLREANTLCSKSASIALTGIGLEIKTMIDQIKEQVQNLA
jgi:uncharacterized protein (TIGR00255 family)